MRHPVKAVHFQLTGRCNLACSFCGQNKGMLGTGREELPVGFWLRCAEETEPDAPVTFWGGEPLLYAGFEELADRRSASRHPLEIVTNGTLAGRHAETLCRRFPRIFISVDGPRELHDAVRGKGVFDRVRASLEKLRERRGRLVFLTTVSDANVGRMAELPELLAPLGPDEIILQQLMYLTGAEIAAYRNYSRTHFGCDYPELEAWRRDDDAAYLARLKEQTALVRQRRHPVKVTVTGHRYPSLPADTPPCQAPGCRLHIRHDGEVGFCTDYFGFSIGNAQRHPLPELIEGERAGLWRKAIQDKALPVCDHCAWRLQVPYGG